MKNPVQLQIPVHAHFICPNTPGSKIPSHGIDKFGVEYAIDFVIVADNAKSQKPYRSNVLTFITKGLALSDFYGWGIDIYAPVKGVVAQVVDGVDERNPVNVVNDLRNAARITRAYLDNSVDAATLLGNHVIIKTEKLEYIVLAHLQKNSILVKPVQSVEVSSVIGKLGHSGNSTMPHLHLKQWIIWTSEKQKEYRSYFHSIMSSKTETASIYANSIPLKDQIMFFAN